jgi:ADP-ribose pyrophosphatase YjhB (NUDIX family)
VNFCPNCGYQLGAASFPFAASVSCPQCHAIHYHHLKVGVGAVIERADHVLLLRRSQEPFKDRWNLPAGYVDYGESPENGVAREVAEECCLVVGAVTLLGVHYFTDDPRGNGILITFRCQEVQGEPKLSSESSVLGFFARGSLPYPVAGGGHDVALKAWQALGSLPN